MSLAPLFMDFGDEFSDVERELFDDEFGFGVYPHDVFSRFRRPSSRLHILAHPRRRINPYALSRKPASAVKGKTPESHCVGKDGFQVCMDVQQFKPSELNVKTVDNCVVVEGKHEEREDDHGLITRHFIRKYTLPKEFDPKDVVSTLSSDGVLTIKAALPAKSEEKNERIIQIQQTGPAHLTVKANPKEAVENGEKNNEKMED